MFAHTRHLGFGKKYENYRVFARQRTWGIPEDGTCTVLGALAKLLRTPASIIFFHFLLVCVAWMTYSIRMNSSSTFRWCTRSVPMHTLTGGRLRCCVLRVTPDYGRQFAVNAVSTGVLMLTRLRPCPSTCMVLLSSLPFLCCRQRKTQPHALRELRFGHSFRERFLALHSGHSPRTRPTQVCMPPPPHPPNTDACV